MTSSDPDPDATYVRKFHSLYPAPLRALVSSLVGKIEETGLLEHLDNAAAVAGRLNSLAVSCGFKEPDARATFYGKARNAVRVYYLALQARIAALAYAQSGDKIPPAELLQPHLLNYWWLLPGPTQGDAFFETYLAGVRLNLINDVWIAFESSVHEIYMALVSAEDLERAQHRAYHSVEKLVDKCGFTSDEKSRLKKKLRNPHISITDKQNLLLSLNYPSDRSVASDRAMLELIGSCRNTMHNNSISFKDAVYVTSLGEFRFVKGEPVDFLTAELALAMVNELADIFAAISKAVDHAGEITDPYVKRIHVRGSSDVRGRITNG